MYTLYSLVLNFTVWKRNKNCGLHMVTIYNFTEQSKDIIILTRETSLLINWLYSV